MVSRLTVLMIQSNQVKIIETTEQVEAWMVKNGNLHALLLSCDHEHKSDMQNTIAELKGMTVEEIMKL